PRSLLPTVAPAWKYWVFVRRGRSDQRPEPFVLAPPAVRSVAGEGPCLTRTVIPSIASPLTTSLPPRTTCLPAFLAEIVRTPFARRVVDCASTLGAWSSVSPDAPANGVQSERQR